MGQCEGESFRKCCSRFTASTSEFYATASKCANYSAAAIATSAARSAAIASTNTTSTTITKLGAVANTTGKTERISNKDMGKCIIKRGWWSRQDLLSPGNAIFQSGIPSTGWWKLRRKDATKHGRKGSCSIWSKTCDAQYPRACLDGAWFYWSSTFRLWSWERTTRSVQWRARVCRRTTKQKTT